MDRNDFTPEQLQQLIALGAIPDEQKDMDLQMIQAQKLRNTESPQGQLAGRVYVAANPLEHLAAGIDKYQGAKQMKKLYGQNRDMRTRQTDARMLYLQKMMGAGGQPPMGTPPGSRPPMAQPPMQRPPQQIPMDPNQAALAPQPPRRMGF